MNHTTFSLNMWAMSKTVMSLTYTGMNHITKPLGTQTSLIFGACPKPGKIGTVAAGRASGVGAQLDCWCVCL